MSPAEVKALRQTLAHTGERRLVWLEGDEADCIVRAEALLGGVIYWLGEGPACHGSVPAAKALQRLGQECDTLVFNAFSGFHPDAFGALAGTLRAGGLLLLLTPPRELWPAWPDPDRIRLVAQPEEVSRAGHGFIARLVRLVTGDPALSLLPPTSPQPWQPIGAERPLSDDQARALPAIHKVLHGHRRRPLVLSADRGRGKSSLLGLAAAALLRQQPDLKIVVTAPSQATVATLFAHAARALDTTQEQLVGLEFCSPDRLVHEALQPDLLLVDEAAAIPTPLLEAMLARHSRIVFATTEHGYEGTGRGFHLRFKRVLDRQTPDWQEIHLAEPIRWSTRDPLEPLVFRLLGLNTEVDAPQPPTNPSWRLIGQETLATDEALLNQVFGLLVLAHYQTTPSDLRSLLESPDLDIHLLEQAQNLLGVALVAREGNIAPELAEAIWAGRRRPRGHLLPQSLLAHAGFKTAGERSYARVMRIAIHPALHRHGLGSRLLGQLEDYYREEGLDYLGSAFSASADLLPFWRKAGLVTLRIGLQRDAASGSHAALLLKVLKPEWQAELDLWRQRFVQQLPTLLAGELKELDPALVWQCVKGQELAVPELDEFERDELDCFAHHHKPFELCQSTLQRWLTGNLPRLTSLTPSECQLLIATIWQYADWGRLAARLQLAGKPAIIKALRTLLARLLDAPTTR
ncbi:tRNA(Met) cytidine acetyltransferase TmcA [Aeromonas salmonicida]|uniref:tRNA(Met) cytidine acetyltransferase TmcA n=1 Tax=Aeromonas salmonicida TaxID=645 RepID=A0AAX1PGI5_AERSA|nr:GNAT family N-acetyltransferase [Aeromonas salmonicida]RAJ03727.1 tRNA(Met)-cytidine N(4)-acetyltransferase [Aeromonas salmonicida]